MSTVKIGSIQEILSEYLVTKNYTSIFVLMDENTKKHCYSAIKPILGKHFRFQIKSGEGHKILETCTTIWQEMTIKNMDRHALMINLGGGVIGDMGGFCAATYKRGIDFVQIPTTLLSQVDASVGGKLGIDFQSFKNHIGVFQLPNAVLIDPNFLIKLPQKQLRSGFAEVIKHCLIRDKKMWETIRKKDLEQQNWVELIAHSVSIKQQITTEDPTEKGLRKILNFGHTLGHAIETYFLGGKNHLLHGEAIAAGMICEAYLSFGKKLISASELNEIEEFIFTIYSKINMVETDFEEIVKLTHQDKKNKGKDVRFSILNEIGNCDFDVVFSKNDMIKALTYYSN